MSFAHMSWDRDFNNITNDTIRLHHIKLFIKYMLEYQKKNNIINHCITNAQYLRDHCVANGLEAKVIVVLCKNIWEDADGLINCVVNTRHMCVDCYGVIMEPSYQIASMEKQYQNDYYRTLKDIKDCPNIRQTGYKLTKEEITKFITFQKYAQEMNDNKLLLSNKDYYNKQADYVENKMKIITEKAPSMTKKQYVKMLLRNLDSTLPRITAKK
jgi:hypothetical protein